MSREHDLRIANLQVELFRLKQEEKRLRTIRESNAAASIGNQLTETQRKMVSITRQIRELEGTK